MKQKIAQKAKKKKNLRKILMENLITYVVLMKTNHKIPLQQFIPQSEAEI
jgi:hypothetical protein